MKCMLVFTFKSSSGDTNMSQGFCRVIQGKGDRKKAAQENRAGTHTEKKSAELREREAREESRTV